MLGSRGRFVFVGGFATPVLFLGLLAFWRLLAGSGVDAFAWAQEPTKKTNPAELLKQQTNVEPVTQQTTTSDRLKATIVHLSEKIGERNLRKPAKLAEAADYIQKTIESMGYQIERQAFEVAGFERFPCHNLIVEVLGKDKSQEIVLIGAHYDSAQATPGANDNGSGVAALIEIASQLRGKQFSRTVRFVFFANEEPPFFQRDRQMGSWVYAKACKKRGDDFKMVLSLETMGYSVPFQASCKVSVGPIIGLFGRKAIWG